MEISNTKINYPAIVETIRNQINTLVYEVNHGTDEYSREIQKYINGATFFVDDEQSFVKVTEVKSNGIYVVVRFGSASTNFGSSVCPVTLSILGSQNKIKPAQMFFSAFCSRWSLSDFGDSNSSQIWVTPQVSINFNDVNEGFRTLFSVSGTLVISQEVVKLGSLTYKYGSGSNQEETIDFISYQDNFSNSLAPQPFGNTCGFAVSEANFSTNSFTIGTYLLNSHLVEDCLALKGFRKVVSGARQASSITQNKEFEIYLTFSNGFTNKKLSGEQENPNDKVLGNEMFSKYKCSSISIGQKIGDIPTISISFTL